MNKVLGISFSSSQICFSELAGANGGIALDNAETVQVDFNFEDELYRHKSSQKDLSSISGEIQNYMKRRNLHNAEIALTIGTSQAFLLTIPVDYSEGKQSLNSKIYWELSNYFPDDYGEFVINTYRLNSVMPCKDSDEFLLIAVPKNTLEFVRRIFKICSLNLSLVDIDHFAAEHAVRHSYVDTMTGSNVLMVGLRNGRVDYGYLCDRKYKYYSYSRYSSEPEFNLSLVRKINQLLTNEALRDGVDTIYLYGDDIKEDTIGAIEKMDKAELKVVNPFSNLSISQEPATDDTAGVLSYRYAASCGAALRIMSRN